MEGSAIFSDAKMAESPEESSWTFYIEGFVCDEEDDGDDSNSLSSEHETPSLVSDAASSAVKKLNCDSKQNLGFSSAQNTFKKQKKSTRSVMPAVTDCDLEDTASSPVNSPKVSYINQFMNQRQKAKMDAAEVNRNSLGKGRVFGMESDGNYSSHDIKEKTTTSG